MENTTHNRKVAGSIPAAATIALLHEGDPGGRLDASPCPHRRLMSDACIEPEQLVARDDLTPTGPSGFDSAPDRTLQTRVPPVW